MPFVFTIKQPWFDMICSGQKEIEIRLNHGIFKKLKVNDTIVFKHKYHTVTVIITFIRKYKSFEELFKNEKTKNERKYIYDYYTKQKEMEYGVLAIGITRQEYYISSLKQPFFDEIKSGQKIYELRQNDKKRQDMLVHDYWVFKHNNEFIVTKIVSKDYYNNLDSVFSTVKLEELLPSANTIESGKQIYNNLYPQNETGYICFGLKLLKSTVYNTQINDLEFQAFQTGLKTIDISNNYMIKPNDIIVYVCNDRELITIVRNVRRYGELSDLLNNEDITKILPGVSSKEKPEDILFDKSTYGVALDIELL